MNINDKRHPVWELLNTVVVFGGITLCLSLNASNLDMTELKTMVEFGLMFAGYKSVEFNFTKKGRRANGH